MKKDSNKDPESNPTAALAKILINQVSLSVFPFKPLSFREMLLLSFLLLSGGQEAGKADGDDVGIWCHLCWSA